MVRRGRDSFSGDTEVLNADVKAGEMKRRGGEEVGRCMARFRVESVFLEVVYDGSARLVNTHMQC